VSDEIRSRALLKSASLGAVLGLLVLTTGAVPGRGAGAGTYVSLGTFSEVLTLVRSRYVEPVSVADLFDGAFYGLTGSIDPEADYVPPSKLAAFRRHLEHHDAGIGVVLTRRWGYAVVAAAQVGGPAAAAGLDGGSIIEAVDGTETRGMALWEVEAALEGVEGSTVKLTVLKGSHDGRETVEVRRGPVVAPEPKLAERDGAIVVAPRRLDRDGVALLDRAIGIDRDRPMILDLRDVGGDDLDAALRMAGRLAPAGAIFAREVSRDDNPRQWVVEAAAKSDAELVVLTNGGTRGAAEVLAGFLASSGRARLVGRPTAGLAGRRRLIALPSGGGVYLTVARFKPAEKGEVIGPAGVIPKELVVDRGEDDAPVDRDPILDRALELLQQKDQPRVAA